MESQISYIFWSNKTKGPKQDSQNQVRSYMPERGEPSGVLLVPEGSIRPVVSVSAMACVITCIYIYY
jgi:hypothetical protein